MDEVKVGNVTFTKEDLPALEEIIIKLKHCEHQFNKWSEVKEDWVCRLCGITRREFLGLIDTDIPIITDNKSIKNIEDFAFERAEKQFIPYAYQCNLGLTILECPCFIDGKCPECGCKSKEVLFLKEKK